MRPAPRAPRPRASRACPPADFWKWVANLYNPAAGGLCVLVSHGNFRFDKPVFEAEHRRHESPFPPNVVFFDTLHWFRTVLKHEASYSLLSLYRKTFNTEIHNQHLAIYDVYALNKLISTYEVPLTGTVYPMGATPMLRIPMVGQHTERLLVVSGFEASEPPPRARRPRPDPAQSVESIWAFGGGLSKDQFLAELCARVGELSHATAVSIADYVESWARRHWAPISAAMGGHTELPTPMVTVAFVDRTV